MATAITDLLDLVMQELPSCPKPTIMQEIRRVVIDFYQRTVADEHAAWEAELAPINIREGVSDYDLDTPDACSCVEFILKVEVDGSERTAGADYELYMEPDESGPTKCVLHLNTEPQADSAGGLVVRVALRPIEGFAYVCDRQYCDYCEVWRHGVLAALKAMPEAWGDAVAVNRHTGRYEIGVSDAKIAAYRQFIGEELIAKPRYPFA